MYTWYIVLTLWNLSHMSTRDCLRKARDVSTMSDLPTLYGIKAEDLPPFGKKTGKIFMLGKYSDILSAADTEWAYLFPFWYHQTAQK